MAIMKKLFDYIVFCVFMVLGMCSCSKPFYESWCEKEDEKFFIHARVDGIELSSHFKPHEYLNPDRSSSFYESESGNTCFTFYREALSSSSESDLRSISFTMVFGVKSDDLREGVVIEYDLNDSNALTSLFYSTMKMVYPEVQGEDGYTLTPVEHPHFQHGVMTIREITEEDGMRIVGADFVIDTISETNSNQVIDGTFRWYFYKKKASEVKERLGVLPYLE